MNTTLLARTNSVPGDELQWALIQFHESPPVDRLREYGVRTESYLATGPGRSDAHYAGIPAENLSAVGNLEAVRSITPIRPNWKLMPSVEQRLRGGPDEIPVLVHTFANLSHPDLARQSEGWYAGSLTASEIRNIIRRDVVAWVDYDAPERQTMWETGDEVGDWMVHADGFTADGIGIGVVDDGIDADHTHFDNVDINGVYDYAQCDNDPTIGDNGQSHGTHIAGTIAGSGSGDYGKEQEGMAPDASLYISRVFDDNGDWSADCGWLGTGYKDIFNDQYDAGARVISNSWGHDSNGEYDSGAQKVDEWARNHRDALLVFANGNNGQTTHAMSPAIAKNALAVGATRDGSDAGGEVTSWSADYVGSISSINDIEPPETGQMKPDVNAPGYSITGPLNGNGYEYGAKSGTSMATPVVSSVAGIYKGYYGSGSPGNEIKAGLIATAHDVANPYGALKGYGEINVNNLLYKNRYESTQSHFYGSVADSEEHSFTYDVPSGAEKVVISLSWTDCAGSATTLDPVVNELDLYAGPTGDSTRYYEFSPNRTTHKIVVHNPESGEWTVNVLGYDVSCGSPQSYDGFFRVVSDQPTLDVSVPDTVTMNAGDTAGISIDTMGTGAPVYGIYGELSTSSDVSLTSTYTDSNVWIVGMRSDGYGDNHYVEVTSDTYGTHTVTVTIDSRNAVSGTITKDITVEVVDETPPSSVSNLDSTTHSAGTWSNDDSVGVAWDPATDGETSVAGYSVVWDHSSSTTPDDSIDLPSSTTSTSTTLADGEWYFHIRAIDEYGNAGPTEHIGPFQIDTTAPSSGHSLSGTLGNNGWYTSSVDVTLTASDDLSGVDFTQYQIDGGSTVKGSSFTVSEDGSHTISYNAVDIAENSESPNDASIDIDTTPPSSAFSYSPTDPLTGETVSFDAGDSGDATSGIASYAWDLDGDGSLEANGQTTSYTYSSSGEYTVELTVTDNAGHTDSTTKTVSVTDDSGPTAVSNLRSPSHTVDTLSNQSTIDVAWDPATDDETSVDGYSIAWDHSSSTTPDATIELASGTTSTSKSVTDGTWYFHVRAVDTEGNAGPTEHIGPFQIDTTSPSISSFGAANASGDLQITFDSNETLADISVTVEDGSGTIVMTLTEADFSESGTGPYTYEWTGSVSDGTYTAILQKAADGAGNDGASGESDTVTIGTATEKGYIEGVVTDANSNSVESAKVSAINTSTNTVVASTTTGADGSYYLSVPPGSYSVTATKPGYKEGSTSVEVHSNSTTTANLVMVVDNPAKQYDVNDNDVIETSELRTAIDDWAQGADNALTTQQLRTFIDLWAQGDNYSDWPT